MCLAIKLLIQPQPVAILTMPALLVYVSTSMVPIVEHVPTRAGILQIVVPGNGLNVLQIPQHVENTASLLPFYLAHHPELRVTATAVAIPTDPRAATTNFD